VEELPGSVRAEQRRPCATPSTHACQIAPALLAVYDGRPELLPAMVHRVELHVLGLRERVEAYRLRCVAYHVHQPDGLPAVAIGVPFQEPHAPSASAEARSHAARVIVALVLATGGRPRLADWLERRPRGVVEADHRQLCGGGSNKVEVALLECSAKASIGLDHLCRQRDCVNPQHLEPVTQTENIRRGAGTKLSIDQARSIRASRERQQVIADRYGISQPHVSCIKSGKCWADAQALPEAA
jgi:hypothetical protein